jgi:4-hydroxybenzoate polyprenyltransferase/phosphoserine phosphatase
MINSPQPQPAARALCVDLDGTLIATDLLWESLVVLARDNPLAVVRALPSLMEGRARFKRQIAECAIIDPATLPYRREVVELVTRHRQQGGRTLLVTAADSKLAHAVAAHLGIFDGVLASDGTRNLKGSDKLARLQEELGPVPFDYMGDSAADLPLWQAATQAYVVSPGPSLLRRIERAGMKPQVLPGSTPGVAPAIRALRPHQWAKNVLVFIPVLAAHQFPNVQKMVAASFCFLAFCLCASGVYVFNDLMDLEADRRHASKRNRPIASGQLSIPAASLLSGGLIASGLAIALRLLNVQTAAMLVLYATITTAYSMFLKRKMMVDVLTLAGLYTLRVLAGGLAAGTKVSSWLLAFSMFLFLSLAFAKRYTELSAAASGGESVRRRGYSPRDLDLVRSVGPTSGYIAALLVLLYVDLSPDVARLYRHPSVLNLLCPLLLYWITRVWFLAQRQQLVDDPVVFALRDRISRLAGVVGIAVLLVAGSSWTWGGWR